MPGKALREIAGGTVIQHVMRAVRGVPADAYALLTDPASLSALRPLAEREGFAVMAGPEDDVLARYCMAIRSFDVTEVIRATGDNPLTSARLARDILAVHRAEGADLSHYLGVPWGSGVEVVRASALLAAAEDSHLAEEREHVTMFLYRHRERFRVVEPAAPAYADCASCRVTVDTPADLQEVSRLFGDLYRGSPIEIEDAVRWWRQRRPREVTAEDREQGRG